MSTFTQKVNITPWKRSIQGRFFWAFRLRIKGINQSFSLVTTPNDDGGSVDCFFLSHCITWGTKGTNIIKIMTDCWNSHLTSQKTGLLVDCLDWLVCLWQTNVLIQRKEKFKIKSCLCLRSIWHFLFLNSTPQKRPSSRLSPILI